MGDDDIERQACLSVVVARAVSSTSFSSLNFFVMSDKAFSSRMRQCEQYEFPVLYAYSFCLSVSPFPEAPPLRVLRAINYVWQDGHHNLTCSASPAGHRSDSLYCPIRTPSCPRRFLGFSCSRPCAENSVCQLGTTRVRHMPLSPTTAQPSLSAPNGWSCS